MDKNPKITPGQIKKMSPNKFGGLGRIKFYDKEFDLRSGNMFFGTHTDEYGKFQKELAQYVEKGSGGIFGTTKERTFTKMKEFVHKGLKGSSKIKEKAILGFLFPEKKKIVAKELRAVDMSAVNDLGLYNNSDQATSMQGTGSIANFVNQGVTQNTATGKPKTAGFMLSPGGNTGTSMGGRGQAPGFANSKRWN
jgi:hypothetical protein